MPRKLHPAEKKHIDFHREKRDDDRRAAEATYTKGENVLYTKPVMPPQSVPATVKKITTGGAFGVVYWLDLGGGRTARTTGERIRKEKK